jgi:hypothetical protein
MLGPFHLEGLVFAAAVVLAYNAWRVWRGG